MKVQELILEVTSEFNKWSDLLVEIDNKTAERKPSTKKWTIKDIVGHIVFWINFAVGTVELRLNGYDTTPRNKIKDQYANVNDKVWEKIQGQNYPKVRNELTRTMDYCLGFIKSNEAKLTDEDIDEILDAVYHQRHHRAAVKNLLREFKS